MGTTEIQYPWYERHEIKHVIFQRMIDLFRIHSDDDSMTNHFRYKMEGNDKEFVKVLSAMAKIGVKKAMMTPELYEVLMKGVEKVSIDISCNGTAKVFQR